MPNSIHEAEYIYDNNADAVIMYALHGICRNSKFTDCK